MPEQRKHHRRWAYPVAILSLGSAISACEDPSTSSGAGGGDRAAMASSGGADGASPVVTLQPSQARLSAAAQYRCWDDGCWSVVWCDHNICDGAWHWSFPESGTYRLTWKGVNEKCAGSPPYSVIVNGETVDSGRLPQYGSCGDCAARGGYGIFVDRDIGTFELNEGDQITLWARTDFACGIDGPGAYAAYDNITAQRL